MIKATETLKQWHTDGYINADAFSGNYQNAATAFIRGDAAMIANGPWMVHSDIDTKNAVHGLYDELGYAISPGYSSESRGVIVLDAQGTYASGTTDPRKKEAVVAFAKFLGTPSQAFQQINVEGAWPAVKFTATRAQKAKLDPLAAALVAESTRTPRTYTIPTTNGPTGFEQSWINLWPGYVRGNESAADFLKQLQEASTSSTGR